jgi:hypothetical protein
MMVSLMIVEVCLLLLQIVAGTAEKIVHLDDTISDHRYISLSNDNVIVKPLQDKIIKIVPTNTSLVTSSNRNRQLQLFGGAIDQRCEQLVNNTLEGIFAPKDCRCSPVGFPPALVIDCERIEESCVLKRRRTDSPDDKVFCGSPGIRVTVNVWSVVFGGSPVVAELCFYDVSVFNVTVPNIINPFCFGLFAGLPGSVPLANLLGLIFGSTASTAKLLQDTSSSKSTTLRQKKQKSLSINEKSCVPTFGDTDQKCNSCTICPPDQGGGMIFDCSNIVPNFVSTNCTIFPTFA